jgi:hypothetical protein
LKHRFSQSDRQPAPCRRCAAALSEVLKINATLTSLK